MHLVHHLVELEVRVEQVPHLLLMLHLRQEQGVAEVELLQVQVQKELADQLLALAVMEPVVEQVMLQQLVVLILVVEAAEVRADLYLVLVMLLCLGLQEAAV